MLRILVGIGRRDLAANSCIPLVTQMHEIGCQMVLLLLRHFCQLMLYLSQAHGQKLSAINRRASGVSERLKLPVSPYKPAPFPIANTARELDGFREVHPHLVGCVGV